MANINYEETMQHLRTMQSRFSDLLPAEDEAIDTSIAALKTLEDINLNTYAQLSAAPIDFKTLFEQITMYATYRWCIQDFLTEKYYEIYDYEEAPIRANVTYNWKKDKILSISFTMRTKEKENMILCQ